eukprot:571963-Amorphochlora_amoeboformis.AAC.1
MTSNPAGFHDVDFFLVTNDSPMREDMKKAFNCQPTSCVFETSPSPNTKFVEKEGSDARLQYNEQILGTEMIMNSTKEYTQVNIRLFRAAVYVSLCEDSYVRIRIKGF